jgi:NADP-dependent 3-hydroxy acid dehydrogenase YdfG
MTMAGRLQGKIAFLTGASVGIGGETARRFAEEGATLVIAARREGPLLETAQRIRADKLRKQRALPRARRPGRADDRSGSHGGRAPGA